VNLAVCALTIFAPVAAAAGDPPEPRSAGSLSFGESVGGVTDHANIVAPPDWAYVVEREAGSFLDCGDGMDAGGADSDGRSRAPLDCGVTLTETLIIPAAAKSARIIVHF
ncbi:MAG: hypothetical protein AAFY22_11320, partial [Pseudomonadota bacterium]